jgi:hypothetical protein
MIRIVFFLLVGGILGYFAGFNDAKSHKENVLARVVSRYASPDKLSADVDKKMQQVEGTP